MSHWDLLTLQLCEQLLGQPPFSNVWTLLMPLHWASHLAADLQVREVPYTFSIPSWCHMR